MSYKCFYTHFLDRRVRLFVFQKKSTKLDLEILGSYGTIKHDHSRFFAYFYFLRPQVTLCNRCPIPTTVTTAIKNKCNFYLHI